MDGTHLILDESGGGLSVGGNGDSISTVWTRVATSVLLLGCVRIRKSDGLPGVIQLTSEFRATIYKSTVRHDSHQPHGRRSTHEVGGDVGTTTRTATNLTFSDPPSPD